VAAETLTPSIAGDLPTLPKGWTFEPLKNLVDADRGICYGIVQPGSEDADGVPIVRVNNIRNARLSLDDAMRVSPEIEAKYKRSRLAGGEVLLSLVGSLGETAIVPQELAGWNVARAVGVIPVLDEYGSRWVHLCLRSPLLQHCIRTWATTTVQATLNLGDVARLPIPVPPPAQRSAIAGVLGALDDKIEVNRRMARTLEAMARALFESWFVRFEHPSTQAAAPRMIDSPLGPIPEGWSVGTLGDVAKERRDGVAADEMDGSMNYIALEHMPRRSITLTDWSNAENVVSNKLRFRRGDILFGKLRPYFHKVGVAPVDGVCSTDIIIAQPVEPKWYGFVLSVMSSIGFVAHTDRGSAGTKMPRTNWKDMAAYRVTKPPAGVATQFTTLIQPLVDRIISGIHEARTLVATRDALLPKLISGELAVPPAEAILGSGVDG
jgi:type I restriction enzyme, S subunit